MQKTANFKLPRRYFLYVSVVVADINLSLKQAENKNAFVKKAFNIKQFDSLKMEDHQSVQ